MTETRHLDASLRQAVDAQVHAAGIEKMAVRAAAHCARKHAYEAAPARYVKRGRTERKHRRVTIRSAPDTMSLLTGYLPVEQGVACWAALRQQADARKAAGDERTRGQIMADVLVERLTGQARAEDVNIEVQLMMPLDSLLDSRLERAAQLAGFGPLPGPLAREILRTSQGRKWWRRLFTRRTGLAETAIVGGDPQRRRFDGWLAQLIGLRDQTCRDPFCDAPIRHLDHLVPVRSGGPSSLANGRGVCARGNYVREMPGWRVDMVHHGQTSRPHTIVITTPTGHRYTSEAPQPP